MRLNALLVVAVALIGCGKDETSSSDTDAPVTSTGTAAGTAAGSTPTGSTTGSMTGPPAPNLANCTAVVEFKDQTGAYLNGRTMHWDANGFLVAVEHDLLGANHIPDDAWSYVNDAEGRALEQIHDIGGNGTWDEHFYITYHPWGQWASYEIDFDNNGTIDVSWVYPDNGVHVETSECDATNDGTIDERVYWYYDAQDRLILQEDDQGLDGVIDWRYTYIFPGTLGTDKRMEYDYDADGTPEDVKERSFDAEERVTYRWDDIGNDGIVEYDLDQTYHPSGLPLANSGKLFDATFLAFDNGYYNLYQEYSYDDAGFTTRVQTLADIDEDGQPGGPLDQLFDEVWTWSDCAP